MTMLERPLEGRHRLSVIVCQLLLSMAGSTACNMHRYHCSTNMRRGLERLAVTRHRGHAVTEAPGVALVLSTTCPKSALNSVHLPHAHDETM